MITYECDRCKFKTEERVKGATGATDEGFPLPDGWSTEFVAEDINLLCTGCVASFNDLRTEQRVRRVNEENRWLQLGTPEDGPDDVLPVPKDYPNCLCGKREGREYEVTSKDEYGNLVRSHRENKETKPHEHRSYYGSTLCSVTDCWCWEGPKHQW